MSYTIRHIAGIVNGDFLRFRGDDKIDHLLLGEIAPSGRPVGG